MTAGENDRVVWLDGTKTKTWFVWGTLDGPDGGELSVIYRLSYQYAGQVPEVSEQRMVHSHRLQDASVTTDKPEVGDTVLKGSGAGEYLVLSVFEAAGVEMAYVANKKRPEYAPGRRTVELSALSVVERATS